MWPLVTLVSLSLKYLTANCECDSLFPRVDMSINRSGEASPPVDWAIIPVHQMLIPSLPSLLHLRSQLQSLGCKPEIVVSDEFIA